MAHKLRQCTILQKMNQLKQREVFYSFIQSCTIKKNKLGTICVFHSNFYFYISYLNIIWIYMSHCMTSLLKLEITVWISGFHCQFMLHWRWLIIRNRSVWPTLFLLNVFTALKGTHFYILFDASLNKKLNFQNGEIFHISYQTLLTVNII